MIFVPVGYTFGAGMFEMEQLKGGSPYGAGTYAGDGSRLPSELELAQAFHQGKYFAGIAKKLKGSSWSPSYMDLVFSAMYGFHKLFICLPLLQPMRFGKLYWCYDKIFMNKIAYAWHDLLSLLS